MLLADRRAFLAGLATLGAVPARAEEAPRLVLGRLEDGRFETPVLRARRGEALKLDIVNRLETPASLTTHGLRAEGTLPLAVPSGTTASLTLTPRDAGTFLWRTDAGPSGLLIVEGPQPPPGDGDIPLHIAEGPDKTLLVNGSPGLALTARAQARLRLRIANGTPQRILALTLPDLPLTLMALDGQPCEPFPLEGGRLTLGPGQRADLFCDVTATAGTPILLENFAGTRLEGRLTVSEEPPLRTEPLAAPQPLPDNGLPQTMDFRRAARAELLLSGAGRAPLVSVRSGAVVMLALRNDTTTFQAVHWQGHPARLLDGLDDGWKPFFLDTALVAPGGTERIAFVADRPGRYAIAVQAINDGAPPRTGFFTVT